MVGESARSIGSVGIRAFLSETVGQCGCILAPHLSNGKNMESVYRESEHSDTKRFELSVQNFAQQALSLLRDKGLTPKESLRAILSDCEAVTEFGPISWLVAEQLLFLELVRRHRATRFVDRIAYDDGCDPNDDFPA